MDTALASCTDAASLAAAIAHRCPQARQHGDQWQACCPVHDDQTPSLSITPAADKVLVYCHAQCPLDVILAALGLTRRDLFVHGAAHSNGHRRIVTTYDYVDTHGVLVHQTVRLPPKAFRQQRPDPATPGAWIWNLEGVEPFLYHLPQVLAAIQRGEPIYVVEGEKDAAAVQALGLTATCNAMGAGKGARATARPCAALASLCCPIMTRLATSMRGRSAPRWRALPADAKSRRSIPTSSTAMSPTGCMPEGHGQGWKRTSRQYPGRRGPESGATHQHGDPALDPLEAARHAAATLLHTLATLADAKEDAVLDALPALASLDMIHWMRLKRQLKRLVPGLNRQDLECTWQELRRTAAQQATPACSTSQAQIAAALAKDYRGRFAYDLSRQAWMAYDHGRWKLHETERVTQKVMTCMDAVLQGDYTWNACAGVKHLLRARLAQTVPLETPGWLPFQNGALCLVRLSNIP